MISQALREDATAALPDETAALADLLGMRDRA
jgi:hypothetical protein